MAKVWITKLALTRGIVEAESDHEVDDIIRFVSVQNQYGIRSRYQRPDWHTSESSARKRALKMRDAKVKALRRQLAKLEAMTFE